MKRKLSNEEWNRIRRHRTEPNPQQVFLSAESRAANREDQNGSPDEPSPKVPISSSSVAEKKLAVSKQQSDDLEEASKAEFAVGIDEAGRGCILGPMFVGIVVWRTDRLSALAEMGVKDSKKLSEKRRAALRTQILAGAEHSAVVSFSAKEINALKREGATMNATDEMLFAKALETIPDSLNDRGAPRLALFLDAAGDEAQFGKSIALRVSEERRAGLRAVVSRHHADDLFKIVGAASILAKEGREEWKRDAHQIYGDFHSGYCNPPTLRWLKEWRRANGSFPDICREWKPCDEIERELASEP